MTEAGVIEAETEKLPASPAVKAKVKRISPISAKAQLALLECLERRRENGYPNTTVIGKKYGFKGSYLRRLMYEHGKGMLVMRDICNPDCRERDTAAVYQKSLFILGLTEKMLLQQLSIVTGDGLDTKKEPAKVEFNLEKLLRMLSMIVGIGEKWEKRYQEAMKTIAGERTLEHVLPSGPTGLNIVEMTRTPEAVARRVREALGQIEAMEKKAP